METTIQLRIILTKPTPDTYFGLQNGSGHTFTITEKQLSEGADLSFTFEVKIKGDPAKDVLPKLSGPYVQGPAGGKFTYINIGTYAGEANSPWAGRMKIPLSGITWDMADTLLADAKRVLTTTVPGTKKDGSPNYATVKPFDGWSII